jgi:hypothetical protein
MTAVRKRPLLFNGFSGGILCAGSDGATQQYESEWKEQWYNSADHHNSIPIHDSTVDPPSASAPAPSYATATTDIIRPTYSTATTDVPPGIMAPSPIQNEVTAKNPERPAKAHEAVAVAFDWKRFFAAGAIGVFFGGCVYPLAYAKLDAVWTGTALATVTKKSIVEIATVGILVNSCSMISRGLCRGDKEASTVALHVAQELPTVTRNDFLVWFPYNMLAFSIIPSVVRPFSAIFMEASWQAYISLRSHDFDALSDA